MARVVIDANVIISAVYGGKPLEAVVRALEEHEVCLSESVRQELEDTFPKLSKKLSKEQVRFIQDRIWQVISRAKYIAVSTAVNLSRDPTDDHYLSLCKAARADFLITGDKDLLSIPPKDLRGNGILCSIMTPKSLLESVL